MNYVSPRLWNRRILIASVALIAGMIVLALWWNTNQQQLAELPVVEEMLLADGFDTLAAAPVLAPTAEPLIVVYVSGEVGNQGVYSLPANARVSDLAEAAGGLVAGADLEHINLAQRLSDEQHVHIPAVGAVAPGPVTSTSTGASAGTSIDLNSATIAELDTLDGIGPALAQRIIDYRTEHGPYHAVEDILEVKGISDTLFQKIVAQIQVGG